MKVVQDTGLGMFQCRNAVFRDYKEQNRGWTGPGS